MEKHQEHCHHLFQWKNIRNIVVIYSNLKNIRNIVIIYSNLKDIRNVVII